MLSSVSKELKEFLTRLQPDDLGSKRIRDSSILLLNSSQFMSSSGPTMLGKNWHRKLIFGCVDVGNHFVALEICCLRAFKHQEPQI